MESIKVSVTAHIATITLNRPKSNALNALMIKELSDLLKHIQNDDQIAGVILTGQESFFSAGLDLIALYQLNEEEVAQFLHQFLDFITQLVAFSKPMVAAINGHSPAGGCVMALACDIRLMATGNFSIGLNEIPVGIIVPNSIFKLYAAVLNERQAAKSILSGTLFSPEEAYQIGLVDELVTQQNILTQAERHLKKLTAMNGNTWQKSKLNSRKDLIAAFKSGHQSDVAELLAQWWDPKTRSILKTIIGNLSKKN